MGVPSWKRRMSPILYIDTARKLEVETLGICAHFPKRFMFLITQKLINGAQAVYDNAVKGNETYPATQYDYQIKIGYISMAIAEAEAFDAQLTIARDLVTHLESGNKSRPMPEKKWEEWGGLIVDELALLRAVKKSWVEDYRTKYKEEKV